MPAPVSVIIPTLNSCPTIAPTLACLRQGRAASLVCEVILADGGSSDGIERIAKDVGARLVSAPEGRGGQLHAGAKAAKGRWLLFIHADTVLSPNWVSLMQAHITHSPKAAYCRLAFDQNGLAPGIIAASANLRAAVFGLPYGDQTLLISKALYEKSGGFPDIPLMEDVALVGQLRGQLRALPITATTGSDRYIKDGWFTRSCKNLGTLARYFLGVSPEKLAKRYRR